MCLERGTFGSFLFARRAFLAVPFCLLLTEIKKLSFIERKLLKYLCAHTKSITFALEKVKRLRKETKL